MCIKNYCSVQLEVGRSSLKLNWKKKINKLAHHRGSSGRNTHEFEYITKTGIPFYSAAKYRYQIFCLSVWSNDSYTCLFLI